MQDRILKILTGNQLSATRFADIIGVQKSSISHILSGRNKPSFDFIEKILIKFPDISPEWLILGKGSMYRGSVQTNLFETTIEKEPDILSTPMDAVIETPLLSSDKQSVSSKSDVSYPLQNTIKGKSIERVLVFYKDKTFSEYYPEE